MAAVQMEPQRLGRAALLSRAVLLLVLIAATTFVIVKSGRDRGTLRDLSAADRQALFEKTHAAFTAMCSGEPPDDVREYCREQAELLRRFPECGAPCLEATVRWLPQPTR